MSEIPRLSPDNIPDVLLRSRLYKEIKDGQHEKSGWPDHEIQPDEVLRPELVAYRHYGSDRLKWVVAMAAGLDDWRDGLAGGGTVKLPSLAWLRGRIRHYQQQAEMVRK